MQRPATLREEPQPAPLSSSGPGEWLTTYRFALLLALGICAAFPQVLIGLESFVVRDFGFFAYPLAHFQRESFWRGELPFWNPYNNCGVPFLAQWNTMPLYPPALIYLLGPLTWGLSFFCLLHLFWAGLGMYCLGWRWTGNRLAAAVGGLIFAFNGFSLNMLMWPSHIATLSWAPWVLLSAQKAWREGGRNLILATLAGTLQMLAGGPETILFTWIVAGVFWVWDCVGAWREKTQPDVKTELDLIGAAPTRAAVWRLPLVVLLVTGLSAAQLLPFADLVAHSQRETGYADTRWSIPGWGWANFFVPLAFGRVANMGVFFQYDQGWTSSYYLGMAALALAMYAVCTVRSARTWTLVLIAAVGLTLAFGNQTFVYRSLRSVLPQVSMITYPVKFLTLLVFAVPLLAAMGLRELLAPRGAQGRPSAQRRLLAIGLFLIITIAAISGWAWWRPFATDDVQATLRNGATRAAFVVLVVTALWFVRHGTAGKIVGPCLLLVLIWLDVWTHSPNQNPSVPPWIFQPGLARAQLRLNPTPSLGGTRAMVTPAAEKRFTHFTMRDPKQNFLIKRLGLFADCNLLDDIPKPNGFLSLYPRECGELASLLYGDTNRFLPRLAEFMSVSHSTAPDQFYEWVRRDSWLPLVMAGQKPVFVADEHQLGALTMPDFDGSKFVVLSPGARETVSVTNQTSARVLGSTWGIRSVVAEVEAESPSMVTVAQTFYHNWSATIDGEPSKLLRANYAFQAVQVPAGKHRIELTYRDRAFWRGLYVSAGTFIACIVGWFALRRRKEPKIAEASSAEPRENPGATG